MIKTQLAAVIAAALESARSRGELALDEIPPITLEVPKNRAHGDWATNVAMTIARSLGQPPIEIANKIIGFLPVGDAFIASAEVAGPGFINVTLNSSWVETVVRSVLSQGERFGRSEEGAGRKVLVEFVSTNPNGPITVAGGRNAALGDAVASLLDATGWSVTREYYINDALNSVQMVNFGKSVFHRYKQLLGHPNGIIEAGAEEPDWLYHGDYVTDIARNIIETAGRRFEDADADDPQTIQAFRDMAQDGMIAEQKSDLAAFGVAFDSWFSEADLHSDGRVRAAIDLLSESGFTYEKDGALWLRSTDFGDDKDRVLVRASGTPTYIAGDVAYHKDKFDRGYELAIDVWGADHAGYVARTKAAVAELGYDPNRLEIILYQLVRIMKDGEFVKSSKRRGDVLELKSDLIDEIGKDAARFFYLTRSANTELDIDVDLAKRTERDNPVYYVQYAFARISQAIEKAQEADSSATAGLEKADLSMLTQESEVELVRKLAEYPYEVSSAARDRAPQRITQYLRDLAADFHAFYDSGNRAPELRINCVDANVRKARLALATATSTVLRNALALLGVSAPDRM
jgi:arginyl-tRNA synthetase